MARKPHLTLVGLAVAAFLCIFFILSRNGNHGMSAVSDKEYSAEFPLDKTPILVDNNVLHGEATAPKLENATLKYVSICKIVLDLCSLCAC